MEKSYKSIRFEKSYLNELKANENACVEIIKSVRHLALHPFHLSNVNNSIKEILGEQIAKYDKKFNGILLGFQNVKLLGSSGSISFDSSFTHLDIEAEFVVFKPEVGRVLCGVVNKKSKDHVGCLVHKFFNVSLPRPTDCDNWMGTSTQIGQEIQFRITFTNLEAKLPYIKAEIISLLNDDSGISTGEETALNRVTKFDDVAVDEGSPPKKKSRKRRFSECPAELLKSCGDDAAKSDRKRFKRAVSVCQISLTKDASKPKKKKRNDEADVASDDEAAKSGHCRFKRAASVCQISLTKETKKPKKKKIDDADVVTRMESEEYIKKKKKLKKTKRDVDVDQFNSSADVIGRNKSKSRSKPDTSATLVELNRSEHECNEDFVDAISRLDRSEDGVSVENKLNSKKNRESRGSGADGILRQFREEFSWSRDKPDYLDESKSEKIKRKTSHIGDSGTQEKSNAVDEITRKRKKRASKLEDIFDDVNLETLFSESFTKAKSQAVRRDESEFYAEDEATSMRKSKETPTKSKDVLLKHRKDLMNETEDTTLNKYEGKRKRTESLNASLSNGDVKNWNETSTSKDVPSMYSKNMSGFLPTDEASSKKIKCKRKETTASLDTSLLDIDIDQLVNETFTILENKPRSKKKKKKKHSVDNDTYHNESIAESCTESSNKRESRSSQFIAADEPFPQSNLIPSQLEKTSEKQKPTNSITSKKERRFSRVVDVDANLSQLNPSESKSEVFRHAKNSIEEKRESKHEKRKRKSLAEELDATLAELFTQERDEIADAASHGNSKSKKKRKSDLVALRLNFDDIINESAAAAELTGQSSSRKRKHKKSKGADSDASLPELNLDELLKADQSMRSVALSRNNTPRQERSFELPPDSDMENILSGCVSSKGKRKSSKKS